MFLLNLGATVNPAADGACPEENVLSKVCDGCDDTVSCVDCAFESESPNVDYLTGPRRIDKSPDVKGRSHAASAEVSMHREDIGSGYVTDSPCYRNDEFLMDLVGPDSSFDRSQLLAGGIWLDLNKIFRQ